MDKLNLPMTSKLRDLATITITMRDKTSLMGEEEITGLFKTTVHCLNTIPLDVCVATSRFTDGQLPALE